MVRRPSRVIVALASALVFTACGGGDTDDADDGDAPVVATTDAAPADDDDGPDTASDTIATDTTVPDPADDERAEDTVPASAAVDLRDLLGLDEVTLQTEPSTDPRPLLAWDPVDGATTYVVSVYTPTGEAYWVWHTAGTEVHLGGEPRLRDEVSGPSASPGMSWSVLAVDATGLPVAASSPAVLHP